MIIKNDDIQRQVKSLYCAANKLRGAFAQCSSAVKKIHFVPIACQCMLVNCGANAQTSMKRLRIAYTPLPTELCITYPET